MNKRRRLEHFELVVGDDSTCREKGVQAWLDEEEKEEPRNGLQGRVGYLKINVEGLWYARMTEKEN